MQKNIILTIQEKKESLPKAEKKLAEWILQHLSEVIHLSVKELSLLAVSSPATIVRFCRSLGLEGFIDLKLSISTNLPQIEEELYTEIIENEKVSQIKKKLSLKVAHVLEETNEQLADEMVEQAIQKIHGADRIYTCGIGASGLVAEDIYQKLTRIGKNVFFSMDYHLLATAIVTQPDQKNVLIAVSNSGEKEELVKLAKIAKEIAVILIAITQNELSTLGEMADILLQTASGGEAPLRSAATSSLLGQLYTVDIFFSAYASRDYTNTISQLEITKAAVQKIRNKKEE